MNITTDINRLEQQNQLKNNLLTLLISKLQFFLSIRLREQLYKAAFMVRVLFTVSFHSEAASESFVIPPPT